jgi:hypothetical protein
MSQANIILKELDKSDELLKLLMLINQSFNMRIHNRHHMCQLNDLQELIVSSRHDGNLFLLIVKDGVVVGYFQILLNRQHMVANIYFGFDWTSKGVDKTFHAAFSILFRFLHEQVHVEKMVFPITGGHSLLDKMLLENPHHIAKEAVLAQEHLDATGKRQPLHLYACHVEESIALS